MKKIINYKFLDDIEIYNFDTKFVFIYFIWKVHGFLYNKKEEVIWHVGPNRHITQEITLKLLKEYFI
jgi:hypothetical protein